MRLLPLLIVGLLAAVPATARDRHADGEAALAKIVADRIAGTPVTCINLRDIRSSEIVDDTAIVYHMNNGTLFVNRPNGGGLLDRDDILVTRTIGTRLCSIDIVTLVDRGSQFPGGSVALGEFVPYPRPPRTRG